MSRDLSAVPSELLELILKRLLSWDDYVHFRSVCTSWRAATPKRPHLPLILLKPSSIGSSSLKLCNFPNLELYSPPKLPPWISRGVRRICGSSRSWICSVGTLNCMYLHNPFIKDEISLPNLPERVTPIKVVLSSDPTVQPSHCVVTVNCLNRLMFYCHPGDISRTPALNGFPNSAFDYIQDTIFYKNKSYAVSGRCRLFVCNFRFDYARFLEICPAYRLFTGRKPIYTGALRENYLVVSSGNLLLAQIISTHGGLLGCEVFRVDLDDGLLRLFKLENLGGRALFLGRP